MQHLVPSKVEQIFQDNDYSIAIGLKTDLVDDATWLTLCWNNFAAGVSSVGHPPRRDTGKYSFAATLRSFLKGKTLVNISMPSPFERIIALDFGNHPSADPVWRLVVEVLGARSNVVLFDYSTREIQSCAYQVNADQSKRPLQTSGTYESPPAGTGLFHPSADVTQEDFNRQLGLQLQSGTRQSLQRALLVTYKGMSPNVADTLITAAGLDPSEAAEEGALKGDSIRNLYAVFRLWTRAVSAHSAAELQDVSVDGGASLSLNMLAEPHRVQGQGGKDAYSPIRFQKPTIDGGNVGREIIFNPQELLFSSFTGQLYGDYLKVAEFDRLRRDCVRSLGVKTRKVEKIDNEFAAQLREIDRGSAEEYKSKGDLITSFLHRWQEGASGGSLKCDDFLSGEEVEIEIPPPLHPADYARQLYKKAQKLRRSEAVLKVLSSRIREHRDYLQELDVSLDGLDRYRRYEDIDSMRELIDELEAFTDQKLSESLTASRKDLPQAGSRAGAPGKSKGTDDYNEEDDPYLIKNKKRVANSKSKKKAALKASAKGGKVASKTSGVNKNSSGGSKAGSGGTSLKNKKKLMQGLLVVRPEHVLDDEDAQYRDESDDNDGDGDDGDDGYDALSGSLPAVVVGRTSRQNDRVSFEVAREHHVWFHVQGCPGSHCLLLLEPGCEAPPGAIQYAADIAAHFSKARHSTQVSVGFVPAKYVKKVSGGAPGLVSVLPAPNGPHAGTVFGRPDRGEKYVELFAPRG
jgi:predicted ribosome quality control (RQC) complex YloA/Tae2 family protein